MLRMKTVKRGDLVYQYTYPIGQNEGYWKVYRNNVPVHHGRFPSFTMAIAQIEGHNTRTREVERV